MTRCAIATLYCLLLGAACGAPRVKPGPLTRLSDTAGPTSQPDPWAGRTDLIEQPPHQPASALGLPPHRRTKLRNGLPLLALQDRRLPLIGVQLLLKAGAIDEPAAETGLAEFTAQMLRQGTRRMSADQISRTVDQAGASLTASSGYEFTSIACGGRTRTLELCLQLVADLARSAGFPAKELEEVRDRLKGGVKSALDDPATLAGQHFDNLLYGDDHPAGRPMTIAALDRIGRPQLQRFHRRRFVPGNALLAVSGDVDLDRVQQLARRFFGAWRGKLGAPRRVVPVKDPPAGFTTLLVDKPDLTQSFFRLGHAGIGVAHPQRDATRVLNYVLGGGGFSSRLMAVVRAKGGKTYGISSHFSSASDDGAFFVASFTRTAQTVATLGLVRGELERIRRAPPTAAEIAAAKGKLAGGYLLGFQTAAALAAALAEAQLRGLPDSHVTERALRIDRLSPNRVRTAAIERVRAGHLICTIVGKAAEVAPQLRRAKIPFVQISFLDPISARQRLQRAQATNEPVSPRQRAAARQALQRAIRAAGGASRLAQVKRLRLTGEVQMGDQQGRYTQTIELPKTLDVQLTLGQLTMSMSATASGGSARIAGGPRKPLPPSKLRELHAQIWRQPPLVLLHATAPGVTQRLVALPDLPAGTTAVEVRPPDLPAATLILDRQHRLAEVRHETGEGKKIVKYGAHRRVRGIWFPHEVSVVSGGQRQRIRHTLVEINPPEK